MNPQTPASKPKAIWLWRPTAPLVNSVRFIAALFTILILLIVGMCAFLIYEKYQAAYLTISASAAEVKAFHANTDSQIIQLQDKVAKLGAMVEKYHTEVIGAVADVGNNVSTAVHADGAATRKAIAPLQDGLNKVSEITSDVSDKLQASRQDLADQKKVAAQERAALSAEVAKLVSQQQVEPAQPVVPEHPASSVAVSFSTNASSRPNNDPSRSSAIFDSDKGGVTKVFSRSEVEFGDIVLAQVPGIHATLIYKTGVFKTWTRLIDLPGGGRFTLADMRDAKQVMFWSDNPFWATWNKY